MKRGLLAEFETPEAMLRAIKELRSRGYRRLDAFTPYPVHGVDEALGLRRSPLNWILLPFSLAGAAGGYLVQWYLNAVDYPVVVGGRPAHAAPAFVPITFEMMVLTTALVGLVAMVLLSKLPELWSPVFEVPGFERATLDRFWIGIDARDPTLIRPIAERDLTALGARTVAWAGKERP
ncbi:membrane protein [Sorangium cellulosum]|uniref:Membrane protein n=1 Tax=Sorangium cellulosum TaxID=56 RepID=A0A4P2Q333_SORCE|nr:DUF3341 domain-containing protein [Sorangium cellulosum]AUX23727.1 membrane protein [Sorangium cellulosum]